MPLSVEECRSLLQVAVRQIAEPIQRAAEILDVAAEAESRVLATEAQLRSIGERIIAQKAVLTGLDAVIQGRIHACDEAIAAKRSMAEHDLDVLKGQIADVKWQLADAEQHTKAQMVSLEASLAAKQKEHDEFQGRMDRAMMMKQGELDNLRKNIAELVKKHGLHANA